MVADISITPGSPSWLRLARIAKLLSSLTLVWLGSKGQSVSSPEFWPDRLPLSPSGWIARSRASRASSSFGGSQEPGRSRSTPNAALSVGWRSAFFACSVCRSRSDRDLGRGCCRRDELARYRFDGRYAGDLSVARRGETAHRRKARLTRHLRRGNAKRPLRHPCGRGARRVGRQHPVRPLVARSSNRACDLRDLCPRRPEGLAGRGVRVCHLFLGHVFLYLVFCIPAAIAVAAANTYSGTYCKVLVKSKNCILNHRHSSRSIWLVFEADMCRRILHTSGLCFARRHKI